jgi:hypothetical protein
LRELMDRHRIAFWDNWQGLALHDGAVFLGLRESPLTLRDLPHNLENDYFYLYIINLFCRNRLSILWGEMMNRAGRLGERVRRSRRIWGEFRNFQDDWLGELTRKPQGLEIQQRFRAGLGLDPVFEDLRAKVREYQEFYELKLERRVSDLLALLTFIGVPAGALCSLFGSALSFQASWGQFVAVLLGVWITLGVIWLVWTHRDEIFEDDHNTFGEGV